MLGLLLLSHCKEVLSVHTAACVHGHAHSHKAGHGSGLVGGGSLHCIGLCADQGRAGHHGILQNSSTLELFDHLRVLGRQGDAAKGDADDLKTTQLTPFHGKGLVHGIFQLGVMGNDLVGTKLHVRQLCKSRLQRADKLRFQLAVQFIAGVVLRDVAADFCIEQQGVRNAVGVHAGAADGHIHIQSDFGIHHAERDRVWRAEFVVDQLFGVEVIHPLILSGVAAKGKALAHRAEGLQDTVTQRSGEDAGFRGGVVCKLSRLGADLHDLALLHDHHALPVRHGDDAAVGNNIVIALGIGRAGTSALAALHHHSVLIHCLAIEVFLPLVGQSSA